MTPRTAPVGLSVPVVNQRYLRLRVVDVLGVRMDVPVGTLVPVGMGAVAQHCDKYLSTSGVML